MLKITYGGFDNKTAKNIVDSKLVFLWFLHIFLVFLCFFSFISRSGSLASMPVVSLTVPLTVCPTG